MKIFIIFILLAACNKLFAQTRFMYDANSNMTVVKTKGLAGNCNIILLKEAVQLSMDDSIKLMEQTHNSLALAASPNPIVSLVMIDYYIDKDTRAAIQLMSAMGQKISILPERLYKQGFYRTAFNMQSLPAQTYFISLLTPDRKTITVKVLKQ